MSTLSGYHIMRRLLLIGGACLLVIGLMDIARIW